MNESMDLCRSLMRRTAGCGLSPDIGPDRDYTSENAPDGIELDLTAAACGRWAMAKFDLEKTSETLRLLQTPGEGRDEAWRARFYAAVVDASFASSVEQVMSGPDGFPYFILRTPPEGVGFE